MSNRKFIIIFSLVGVLLIGVLVYVGIDLFGNKTETTTDQTTTKKSVFNFLDFGKKTNTTTPDQPEATDTIEVTQPETTTKKLIRLSSRKVSSYGFFEKENSIPGTQTTISGQNSISIKSTGINFTDKETGLIYQIIDEATENSRLSNNTTPLLGKSLVGNNGQSVVYQYTEKDGETISTYIGKLEGEVPPFNIRGFFLPKNIVDISLSPKGEQLFSIIPTPTGVIGLTQNLKTNKKSQPWSSVFSEWISDWSNDNTITLTTKSSGMSDGYSYFLNVTDGRFTKVIGPEKGLITKTSPDAKNILYSKIENGKPKLYIFNVNSKISKSLDFMTFAEKCTWSDNSTVYCAVPNSMENTTYPDAWYRGEVSFQDSFWKIETDKDLIVNIASLSDLDNIDAEQLSYKDGVIYFINKNTQNLWKYIL